MPARRRSGSGWKPSTAGTFTTGTPSTTRSDRASWRVSPCSSACSTYRAWPACSVRPRPRSPGPTGPDRPVRNARRHQPHRDQEDRPPPAPRPAHRERARPGAQHARRHQPGARPRRRRHAQKCVAAIAVTSAGGGEARPRPLRPPGRLLSVDEYQAFASVGEDDPSGDEKAFALTRQWPGDPHRRHAIHQLTSLRSRQRRGVADVASNAPHPDIFESQRRGQRRDCLEAVRASGENQKLVHDQRIREIERDQPHVRPGRRRGAAASARARVFTNGARRSFSRATSPSSGTVRRSVSRTTAYNRSPLGAST